MLPLTRRSAPIYLARVAWLFLAFVAGAAVHHFNVPPGAFLQDAFTASEAVWDQWKAAREPSGWTVYGEASSSTRGVSIHDGSQVSPGYTLYAGSRPFEARLIDLDGNVVHSWRPPYEQLRAADDDYFPPLDVGVYIRRVQLLPNGDLLVILVAQNRTPWGLALIKLDRDSNLLWSYSQAAHHDLSLAPDGRIFALTHAMANDLVPGARYEPPMVRDYVVELSPDGKEQQRISVMHAIAASEFSHILRFAVPNWRKRRDYLHTNAVRYIDEGTARAFPFARPGHVLVEARTLDALIVIDPATERATWMTFGFWRGGHDPDLLANGNVLLFDNLGVYGEEGTSRVVEVDLRTMSIVWEYRGDAEHPLHSRSRACQQRLANGNTFIVETNRGRLLEVTQDKEIVWEFYHPSRVGADRDRIPAILWAERISPDDLTPAFREALGEGSGD